MRTGFTTIELAVTLSVIGVLLVIAIPRFLDLRDRAGAHGAASDVVSALTLARHVAIVRATRVAVRLDASTSRVMVEAARSGASDTLMDRPLTAVHGAALTTTRDSVAYGPTGLGYGAANTTIVLTRGQAAETVAVSRLGRVRR